MLVCYALEARSPWFILAFAGACALGSVYGALMFCFSFGLGCGPALFGQIHKHTGSYQHAFVAAAALAIVATLLVLAVNDADLDGAAGGA